MPAGHVKTAEEKAEAEIYRVGIASVKSGPVIKSVRNDAAVPPIGGGGGDNLSITNLRNEKSLRMVLRTLVL